MAAQKDGSETIRRDVKQHMLFEVATEVANRGVRPVSLSLSLSPFTSS